MGDTVLAVAPADWRRSTLGEECDRGLGVVQTGPFGSQLHASDYVESGVPTVMPVNIGDNRIIEEGISRIRPVDVERLVKHRLALGDIVYSRRGDVERRALVRDHQVGWLCGTGCMLVRLGPNSHLDPRYASYLLGHPDVSAWVVRHAVGATMPNLNTSILRAVPMVVPPMIEQLSIAEAIATLDDKIELNRRTAATLEEMARALFKSWFVDFDPVRAKAEGLDTGLPSEIADLFPDRLVDSDLGEIPDGWAWASLDRVANFLNGLALQKYPVTDDDRTLPVIKIAQLRAGATLNADRCSSDIPTAYVVEDGDVLFSWSGSLECAFWAGGRGALNQHLFKVTPNDAPTWLGYLGVQHHLPGFRETAAGKATTMGHIQRHHLTDARLPVPPTDAIAALGGVLQPMLDRSWKLRVESRQLTELRDALLPKLVSGAIRISDPEDFLARMEAAVA